MTSITGFPRNQRQNCFFLGLLVAASSFVSPPAACAVGLVFGPLFPHPFSKGSQVVMASSVVGLGFGMDLDEGVRAAATGAFSDTRLGISFAPICGMRAGHFSARAEKRPRISFPFPAIGTVLKLSQNQFGLWAASVIHRPQSSDRRRDLDCAVEGSRTPAFAARQLVLAAGCSDLVAVHPGGLEQPMIPAKQTPLTLDSV